MSYENPVLVLVGRTTTAVNGGVLYASWVDLVTWADNSAALEAEW
jgi:hypothetical protein